jgi:hypothetical protein
MVVELEYISQLPLQESTSITSRIPIRVFQKKLFIIENLHIEEHINSKGIIKRKFATGKYDNEYFKINTPYQTLKETYYTPITIKGFGK